VPVKKTSPSRRDQQYASFLKGIQLLGFGLQESRTAQNRALYAELYEKNRLTRRISTEYRTMEVEKEFFHTARPSSVLQRFTDPSEIASLITYVCSERASATTGAALRADGGVVRSIV